MDIRLEHLTKAYGDKPVLQDVCLTLQKGKHYLLCAPSGRGKTTLLRLILGLEEPDGGTVSGVPQRTAAVFQEDRLCRNLTVLANLRMALGRTVREGEMLALLSELELAEAANKTAAELSGGMARRVALTRAVLTGPELLVLDEPFTGLDDGSRRRCAGAILKHCPRATVLLVSHHPEDGELLEIDETIAL